MNIDYCANSPKPCQKNVGIPRIDMPQINTKQDFQLLKKILLHHFNRKGRVRNLDLKKPDLHHKIFASQKEINRDIAKNIAYHPREKVIQNPIILLYSPHQDEYLVVDGHHRWLAHHLYPQKMKPKMRSYVVPISPEEQLEDAFHSLNRTLREHPHVFHKKHSFHTRKKRPRLRFTLKKR